jgi:hypothetical protein
MDGPRPEFAMTRIFAAALLVLAALTVTSAQEGDKPVARLPIGGGRSYLPFDVVQVDGKTAWQVVGRGSVKVEDLVGGLSSALGRRINYTGHSNNSSRGTVPFVAPETGVTVPNEELLSFANELLASVSLTVVGITQGNGVLARLDEAPRYAPFVSAGEVATMPSGEWVTVSRELVHANEHTIREAVNSTMGRGDSATGVHGKQLLVTGPAWHVRKVLAVVDSVDVAGGGQGTEMVRSYTVPAAVQAQQAAGLLRELFDSGTTTVSYPDNDVKILNRDTSRAHVVALPGNRVLVRAPAATHALVAAAIDAMK